MAGEKKNIATLVKSAISEPLLTEGFDIWDCEYIKEGSEWYLRITIDKQGGVDIDDCEKAYHIVDPIITELDPIENAYRLEVSSPGLERELRTREQYRSCMNQQVRLKFFTPVDGNKEWIGVFKNFDEEGNLLFEKDGVNHVIDFKKISKANIYYDFDEEEKNL